MTFDVCLLSIKSKAGDYCDYLCSASNVFFFVKPIAFEKVLSGEGDFAQDMKKS